MNDYINICDLKLIYHQMGLKEHRIVYRSIPLIYNGLFHAQINETEVYLANLQMWVIHFEFFFHCSPTTSKSSIALNNSIPEAAQTPKVHCWWSRHSSSSSTFMLFLFSWWSSQCSIFRWYWSIWWWFWHKSFRQWCWW